MSDDVVDIRKRIEEIRNEVSTAMASNRRTVIGSQPAGEVAEFSIPGVTTSPQAVAQNEGEVVSVDPATLPSTHAGLEAAMALPSFQLKVRNEKTNKYLLMLVGAQLITNFCLIAILWFKLG